MTSALTWGAGDFAGGLTSRRTPVYGVVLVSQLTGMAIAAALAILRNEPSLTGPDIAWSVAGGILGGIGITALYRGLAVGRMGIVAPVTGVLAALIPVVAGIATEGGGRQGLGLALLAGTTIGLFGVVINQISDGHVFAPLAVVRGSEAVLIVAIILVTRSAWRPTRDLLPVLLAIGVLDMAGNAGYIAAVQTGALAIASVVSGLYPVTTVVLAAVFLHERVTRSHAVGIVLASVAVALIGIGSA